MSFERPVLIIFHGDAGSRPAERMLADARVAAARVSAATALAAGFEAVIIATDEPAAFQPLDGGILLDVDHSPGPFSFPRRLRYLVDHYGLRRPAVMGSGSLPLLQLSDFQLIAELLQVQDRRFVTNNFFSADLTAWTPGGAIHEIGSFDRDNVLPRRFRDDAGLAPVVLPRTTATQFDIDTPADMAVLALNDDLPPALTAAVRRPDIDTARFRAVMPLLCDRTAEIVVAGRVGSQTWQYLERETACRVRMFSEERGLAAAPHDHRPQSVLGILVEEIGVERFFERMALLGDALVLDTRVIEAHLGLTPTREDRFQSDLLAWDRIDEPWLASFTRAAAQAPLPVLLGGHSLVAGGLMALNDVAWRENDRLRSL